MHQRAIEHLRESDPELARIIDRVGDCELSPREGGTHFDALVRAIIYQQLAGKAAATIHGRVEALFGDRAPTPEEILATDDERLRAAGLSRQKISYIKDLAAKVASGELATESLDRMPDHEAIESLVRVKGIGRWSAQMFLMFRLGRPNVLPDLDLGVQRGIQHAYRLKSLPTPKDVLRIGERWAPHASVASWYMWRLLELPDVIRREAAARKESRAAVKATNGENDPAVGNSSKKPPAMKKPARQAAARKKPARKAPARRKSASKAPARKKPARKAPAKRKPARKAPARKKPPMAKRVARVAAKRSRARRSTGRR